MAHKRATYAQNVSHQCIIEYDLTNQLESPAPAKELTGEDASGSAADQQCDKKT